jgi:hypothetical protein
MTTPDRSAEERREFEECMKERVRLQSDALRKVGA